MDEHLSARTAGYSTVSVVTHWLAAILIGALFVTHSATDGTAAYAFHVGGGAIAGLFLLWRVWHRVRRGMTHAPPQAAILNVAALRGDQPRDARQRVALRQPVSDRKSLRTPACWRIRRRRHGFQRLQHALELQSRVSPDHRQVTQRLAGRNDEGLTIASSRKALSRASRCESEWGRLVRAASADTLASFDRVARGRRGISSSPAYRLPDTLASSSAAVPLPLPFRAAPRPAE